MGNFKKELDKCKHPNSRKTKALIRQAKRLTSRNDGVSAQNLRRTVLAAKVDWFRNHLNLQYTNYTAEHVFQLIQVDDEPIDIEQSITVPPLVKERSASTDKAGMPPKVIADAPPSLPRPINDVGNNPIKVVGNKPIKNVSNSIKPVEQEVDEFVTGFRSLGRKIRLRLEQRMEIIDEKKRILEERKIKLQEQLALLKRHNL